jgi:histidine phosphotransferase ChpT
MPHSVQLAELLCARLCHDLGGPIGGLAGAVELAATGPDSGLADIAAASSELGLRLRLLRAAFGAGGIRLDRPRLTELAAAVPGADRLRIDLDGLPRGASFAPSLGRVLLNLLLLAPEGLPRGGTLTLTRVDEAAVLARLTGPRAAWPNGFATYLGDPAAARAALVPPRFRLAPWVALLAAQLGVQLSLLVPAGRARGPAPLLLRGDAAG